MKSPAIATSLQEEKAQIETSLSRALETDNDNVTLPGDIR